MTDVVFEKDSVRFLFYKPGFGIAGCIFFLILTLIGAGLIFGGFSIIGFENLNLKTFLTIWISKDDKSTGPLAMFLMGYALIICSVVIMLSRNRGSKNYLPAEFTLNNLRKEFIISETTANGGETSAIPYGDILDFTIRHYTTQGNNNICDHYTLCMVLREGAFWDLYDSYDQKEILDILDKVHDTVKLSSVKKSEQLPALSQKIRYSEDGQKKIWVWTNKNFVAGLIIAIIFYIPFAITFVSIFKIMIPGMIIGGFFLTLILALLVYRLYRSIEDLNWDQALFLEDHIIQSGRINRKNDQTIIDTTIKLKPGYRVLYNFDACIEYTGGPERVISIVRDGEIEKNSKLKTSLIEAAECLVQKQAVEYLARYIKSGDSNDNADNKSKEICIYAYGLLCSDIVTLDRNIEKQMLLSIKQE